jgi:hypothetical protein
MRTWPMAETCRWAKTPTTALERSPPCTLSWPTSLARASFFMDLLVKFNVHRLPRHKLEPFVHSLEHVLVDDNNRKVFVAPAVAQLPSDQEVREFVWGYPRRIIRSVT